MNNYYKKKSLNRFQFIKRGVALRIVDLLVTITSIILTALFFDLKYFSGFELNLLVWLLYSTLIRMIDISYELTGCEFSYK